MNNKKILMITGDFTEDYETMVPFQTLMAVGIWWMLSARVKRVVTQS
ncbi:hypothetical protein SAMN05421760_10146 [Neptunomonas antarctica]|uniref:Protease I n=1 Tax=Neptunomonas antarctica TaxID=619304 RepID=A0A1N7ISB9_9GAMM|nr:hypothetical protein SAMN05421760_10146 [Neptunomonas antarctica]